MADEIDVNRSLGPKSDRLPVDVGRDNHNNVSRKLIDVLHLSM